jgi:hypothetical protein
MLLFQSPASWSVSLSSSSHLHSSAIYSATAYQCPDFDSFEPLCPGICCQRSDPSPIQLLTGPTCQIQAAWFVSSNETWVWPFPTFRFTYYWSQEDIMGRTPGKQLCLRRTPRCSLCIQAGSHTSTRKPTRASSSCC